MRPHRRQPTRLPRPWDSPGKNTGVGCHFLLQCMKVKSEREVAQSCPTLSDPMDCSLPGSSGQEYCGGVPLPFPYHALSCPHFVLMVSSCGLRLATLSALGGTWASQLVMHTLHSFCNRCMIHECNV